jgi:two-component system, chemotaxis family, sensor kinase CheA
MSSMFALDDDLMRQLRATFAVEAVEHIQAMNRVLLALEANPEGEERKSLLEEIFREAHSLKGAAGAADFGQVQETAHKLESVFGAAKAGKLKLTPELCDVLYAGIDAVNAIVEASLDDKPHGLDLAALYVSLQAAEQGQVVPLPKQVASAPEPVPAPSAVLEPAPGAALMSSVVAADTVAASVIAAAVIEPPPPPAPAPVAQPLVAAPPQPAPVAPAPASEEKLKPAPSNGSSPEHKKAASHDVAVRETIRVTTTKIDDLMAQSGELLVAGLKINQHLHDIEAIMHSLEDWNREALKLRALKSTSAKDGDAEALRPLLRLLDLNQDRLRALMGRFNDLGRGFSRDALHLARVTNDLSEGVMKVRMLPVSSLFDGFPRIVRDVARERGKEVELVMEGAETELDRKMLEELKDPLVHLLRNAVDHGIELPDERVQAGKPRLGTITLKAFQKGNSIAIEVADDGAGINRQKVKQAAVKAELLSAEEAGALNDDEALRLIFASGLSTRSIIDGISGRGVGMDVVRKNVEALQGQVDIDSTLGQGTTITLTLPLTLATTQELLVQVGDQTYGIPISAVERIFRISPKDIATVSGRRAIVVDKEPISLVALAEVLERQDVEQQLGEDKKMPVVILSSGRKRIAFLVDGVVGQQESVVKSLGKQLARVRNVSGATILGSGRVIMTLNPVDLYKSARMAANRTAAAVPAQKPKAKARARRQVLVVDDSLSTRTLEKNILETAGYRVTLATNGAEALGLLKSNGGVDLIVSDILMPQMTGLELTAAVKKDSRLKKIPVVLVTSLDSRDDKERGIEVGADAYLVKSNFDQSNLLQTIAQLI